MQPNLRLKAVRFLFLLLTVGKNPLYMCSMHDQSCGLKILLLVFLCFVMTFTHSFLLALVPAYRKLARNYHPDVNK